MFVLLPIFFINLDIQIQNDMGFYIFTDIQIEIDKLDMKNHRTFGGSSQSQPIWKH